VLYVELIKVAGGMGGIGLIGINEVDVLACGHSLKHDVLNIYHRMQCWLKTW
jgi:hypothetical protein